MWNFVRLGTAQGAGAVHRQAYRLDCARPDLAPDMFEWAAARGRPGSGLVADPSGERVDGRGCLRGARGSARDREPVLATVKRALHAVAGPAALACRHRSRNRRGAHLGIRGGPAGTGPNVARLLGEPSPPAHGMTARPQFEAWRVGRAVSRAADLAAVAPDCLPQAARRPR